MDLQTDHLPILQATKETHTNPFINDHPQQKTITIEAVTFDSKFDSGNLSNAIQTSSNSYDLYLSSDGLPYPVSGGYRVWFYFSVTGIKQGEIINLNIKNMTNQRGLFGTGLKPVYRVIPSQRAWRKIPGKVSYGCKEGEGFQVNWGHQFNYNELEVTYFALCYPYSTTDCHEHLSRIENKLSSHKSIYFHRENIINSIEKRKVEMITISSYKNITTEREPLIKGLFPDIRVWKKRASGNKPPKVPSKSSIKVDVGRVEERKSVGNLGVRCVGSEEEEEGREEQAAGTGTGITGTGTGIIGTGTTGIPISIRTPTPMSARTRKSNNTMERESSAGDSMNIETMDNGRPYIFHNKPVVFLSARVHPGEVPASLVLNGIIDFILNERNEQARLLRDNYVFKVVPLLNPDGVSRGYYRLDTKGQNLNRFYTDPNPALQPTIFAVKKVIVQQSQLRNLAYYIDFHGHAVKRGAFIFGNCLPLGEHQVENCLFPKLVALNSLNFDFAECNFSERQMSVKDRRDGLSREGCGRVGIFKATNLAHCYTLECHYHTSKRINYIPPLFNHNKGAVELEAPINDISSKYYEGKRPPVFTLDIYSDIGRAICVALLDMVSKNPLSRLPMSTFKTIENLRIELGNNFNLVPKQRKQASSIDPHPRTTSISCSNKVDSFSSATSSSLAPHPPPKGSKTDTSSADEVGGNGVIAGGLKLKRKKTGVLIENLGTHVTTDTILGTNSTNNTVILNQIPEEVKHNKGSKCSKGRGTPRACTPGRGDSPLVRAPLLTSILKDGQPPPMLPQINNKKKGSGTPGYPIKYSRKPKLSTRSNHHLGGSGQKCGSMAPDVERARNFKEDGVGRSAEWGRSKSKVPKGKQAARLVKIELNFQSDKDKDRERERERGERGERERGERGGEEGKYNMHKKRGKKKDKKKIVGIISGVNMIIPFNLRGEKGRGLGGYKNNNNNNKYSNMSNMTQQIVRYNTMGHTNGTLTPGAGLLDEDSTQPNSVLGPPMLNLNLLAPLAGGASLTQLEEMGLGPIGSEHNISMIRTAVDDELRYRAKLLTNELTRENTHITDFCKRFGGAGISTIAE